MSIWTSTRTAMAATLMAFAVIPGPIIVINPPGVANADVCASVGRRVSVKCPTRIPGTSVSAPADAS